MVNPIDENAAYPAALKLVLGLGAFFVLILLGIRLADLASLALAVSDRVPLLRVSPHIQGTLWLALAMVLAPLVFLLPRAWRKAAGFGLLFVCLIAVAISGNSSSPGGASLTLTPMGHWLQSQGYTRCTAGDQIHHGLHANTVSEGWAQPLACSAAFGTTDQAH